MSARESTNTNDAIITPECIRSGLVRTNNTKIYNSDKNRPGKDMRPGPGNSKIRFHQSPELGNAWLLGDENLEQQTDKGGMR